MSCDRGSYAGGQLRDNLCFMSRPDVTTAAHLDAMTPADRHADFESRVVTSAQIETLPASDRDRAVRLLDRARVRAAGRIADSEGPGAARRQPGA